MWKMIRRVIKVNNIYEEMFTECVEYRLEELEKKLPRRTIKRIVEKLIYECDNMWEYINDTIDWIIERESD